MTCTLSKLKSYDVGRIVHDNESGVYTVQLINSPSSCPEGVFTSKKANVQVVSNITPQLSYNLKKNQPLILVPTEGYIEQVGSSGFGFGYVALFLIVAAGLLGLLVLFRSQSEGQKVRATTNNNSTGGKNPTTGDNFTSAQQSTQQQPNGGGNTVINNNGGGNDGLLTGVLIGNMLSGNRSERIVERETIIRETPSTFSSDNSDNSDTPSSDDSGSDDSGSSFSSDSDSDSSFSSDSGGSDFSSDSGGGGDFSSDS